jgi:hypothetical protein
MAMAVLERVCARAGCGQPVTGRADKRYCSDLCRNAANRNRSDPIRSAHRAATVAVIRPDLAPVWDPPGEPRQAYRTEEPCPDCGDPLLADPQGTWRACAACRRGVVPAAARAPYARGEDAPQRQVISQRERDLEALGLARRKGVMLAQLDALAADDRLHPESVPVVEWLAGEVRAAASGRRLDELAELAADPAAGLRRRRWWHGQPAALPAAYEDQDQDLGEDYDDEDQADEHEDRPGAIAAAGPGPGIDYAAELAAREWVLRPHGPALCHLVKLRPHGWDYVPPEECLGRAAHPIPGGAVCSSCHDALNRPLASA